MQAIDSKMKVPGGTAHRRKYVDAVEVQQGTEESARRVAVMLRNFMAQSDLWKLPRLGSIFERAKVELVAGRWTIEIEAVEKTK